MKQSKLFQKPMVLGCFLLFSFFSFSQVAEQWVKRYNGINASSVTALATDAKGNVYVTGTSLFSDYYPDYYPDYVTIKYDTYGNELWVKRYSVAARSYERASALVVDANGNAYVTGISFDDFYADYITVKYDAAGNERWARRYDGPNNYDRANALAVDANGNVYVTGVSTGSGTNFDYATIKYDAAGNEVWVKRYNGPKNGADEPTAIGIDADGNVYVTGSSNNMSFSNSDYATIKYDAAGNEVWIKRYDGFKDYDLSVALAIDADGNVYITGTSNSRSTHSDYATIKYNAGGDQLWVKRYSGNFTDAARSLAVDAGGNVYVTGVSYSSESNHGYATIKYDANGNERWIKRYDGLSSSGNYPTALVIDADANVYVTGWGSDSSRSYNDYATVSYDAAGNERWVKRYNGPENTDDQALSLAVDAAGNVYVTGNSANGYSSYDYTTIKYAQTQGSGVASFTLIDADNDADIRELKDGDTLNLAILPSLSLAIRANTNPAAVGSVVFDLSGKQTRHHVENTAPYSLFANNKDDYNGWTPANGYYTLTATPYSDPKGKGEKGTPLAIHFTVTGQVVSSLILVNAETDQDIKTLQNGDAIDLAALPTIKLNIRAVTHLDTVGSVVFNLNNRYIVRENLAPYAIGGDIKGDYRAWTLPTGHHSLTATPYDGKYGRGKKGKTHSVSFTVVDMSATTHTGNLKKPITDATQLTGQNLSAIPNPFSGQTNISFSVPRSGYTTLQVHDMKGVAVAHLYQAWAEGGKAYTVSFKSKQLPSGVYVLRLTTAKHVQSYKLAVIR